MPKINKLGYILASTKLCRRLKTKEGKAVLRSISNSHSIPLRNLVDKFRGDTWMHPTVYEYFTNLNDSKTMVSVIGQEHTSYYHVVKAPPDELDSMTESKCMQVKKGLVVLSHVDLLTWYDILSSTPLRMIEENLLEASASPHEVIRHMLMAL